MSSERDRHPGCFDQAGWVDRSCGWCRGQDGQILSPLPHGGCFIPNPPMADVAFGGRPCPAAGLQRCGGPCWWSPLPSARQEGLFRLRLGAEAAENSIKAGAPFQPCPSPSWNGSLQKQCYDTALKRGGVGSLRAQAQDQSTHGQSRSSGTDHERDAVAIPDGHRGRQAIGLRDHFGALPIGAVQPPGKPGVASINH